MLELDVCLLSIPHMALRVLLSRLKLQRNRHFLLRVSATSIGLFLLTTGRAIAHPGDTGVLYEAVKQALHGGLSWAGLVLAFLFGMTHAFSPGHGKTMVAAYLVGSRSTTKQAVALGLITTISHTLSIFALGLLVLITAQYMMPGQIYPILSFGSGLTILGVGLWLLRQHLKTAKHSHHSHHHHYHHHQEQQGHIATREPQIQSVTWRSLITLGISGGIVPCPSALVLLLTAIAVQQTAYGLLLVSMFSMGLATILILLGLVVVHSRQWLSQFPAMDKLQRPLRIGSSLVIICVGSTIAIFSLVGV
jgi:nickel/cobalt exporter